MTNIRTEGMFPETLPKYHHSPSLRSLKELVTLRDLTYTAFANIEKDKGLLRPRMSLSSTEGQEAVRILTQRGLEELVEAYDSEDYDHYLEEIIDAINYFWVMLVIDPVTPQDEMLNIILDMILERPVDHIRPAICPETLGETLVHLNPIYEKLRHRAWMHNPQSQYFDGWREIAEFLGYNLCMVLDDFGNYSKFVQFYIAKDNVLQFRIKTKY